MTHLVVNSEHCVLCRALSLSQLSGIKVKPVVKGMGTATSFTGVSELLAKPAFTFDNTPTVVFAVRRPG